ncbi:DNA glycosylase [Chlamydoabsidia padenii]|nr:DNA glycosylase [Chlamydoabsidia padenii]
MTPTSIEDCVSSRRLAHNTSYHNFDPDTIKHIQDAVLNWFDTKQRTDMPWRKPVGSDWDQEALGQRAYETQVATVIEYYNRWMEAFPTIYDLAAADIEQVNTIWAGLGYYSRASRLWTSAKKVVAEFDGQLPNNADDLKKHIPGVGPYTAGAIASIVFGEQTALVDGNVIRLLARLRAVGGDMKKANVVALFWKLATALVPADRPGDFNQALMELGGRVCTPQNPDCDGCPVEQACHARAQWNLQGQRNTDVYKGTATTEPEPVEHECDYCPPITNDLDNDDYAVTRYPVKADKKPPRDEECAVCILEKLPSLKDGESVYLISKRPDKGLLAGLWEFPSLELGATKTTFTERSKRATAFLKEDYQVDLTEVMTRTDLDNVVHLFSHIRKVYHIEWIRLPPSHPVGPSTEQRKWITMDELKRAPISTGLKKAIKLLEKARASANNKRKQAGSKDIASFFHQNKKRGLD